MIRMAAIGSAARLDLAGLPTPRNARAEVLQPQFVLERDTVALRAQSQFRLLPVLSFLAAPFGRALSASAVAFSGAVTTSGSRCIGVSALALQRWLWLPG